MASPPSTSTTVNHQNPSPPYVPEPTSPNTTYVHADPSNFRTIVQQLTGAPSYDHHQNTPSPPLKHPLKKPTFKLQERRQAPKNLHINLHSNTISYHLEQQQQQQHQGFQFKQQRSGIGFLVSPVSPLELFTTQTLMSPRSPSEEINIEEKFTAEKGFYLHPPMSPLSTAVTPRAAKVYPPELLPLFPLKSPKDSDKDDDHHT